MTTMGIPGLLPREALSDAQCDEMFALLARHFAGVTRAQFERDLAEKNWIVEIRRDGRLLGFTTLLVCEAEHEGRALTAIYSGDTIVAPEAWGAPTLARTWIAAVNHLRAAAPERPCHWLLLTSGFRTYRFLPVFWREFFPRYDAPTPSDTRGLLDHLARARYGGCYAAGIVRFPQPQRLRALPLPRAQDEHAAFFLAQNPGHSEGDELACITEISDENLTAAGRRMIAR
jgi:hypothetical protein